MSDRIAVKQRHWVYIMLHWLIGGMIIVLAVTGFYIHKPFFTLGSETDPVMVMSWIRWTHFICAAILIESVLIRLEMAFFSHFDADWRDIGPSRKSLKALPEALSYFLFLRKDHRYWRKANPVMAVFVFPLMLLFYAIAILTGFALFEGTFFWELTNTNSLFSWVYDVFGGQQGVRTWHYYLIWVFACLALIHVYFALLRTLSERDRTFRSILNGWRLVPRKHAPIRGASGRKKRGK
ncbi:MAG: Ni/Fe-hydrogenase, b-type cytochrome subunit [Gaiellales bacterium]|nr:MAG: Ni/Fe-hydrogenase, b-type cytochrome subunit [Gaiellales bacterium]